MFVSGVGTGGTLTGVSRYIKGTRGKKILTVAVEPTHVAGHHARRWPVSRLTPSPHKIQGIGAGFIPKNLDLSLVDRVEQVTNEESIEMARRLAREEGILSGISCGAAMVAALRLAREPAQKGKTIVVILPDAGERYLSGALFEGLFEEVEKMQAVTWSRLRVTSPSPIADTELEDLAGRAWRAIWATSGRGAFRIAICRRAKRSSRSWRQCSI